jgi:hypothetical protein
MRICSRLVGVGATLALTISITAACGSSDPQLRARGPAPGATAGQAPVAVPATSAAAHEWTLDNFAPAPLPGWHFWYQRRPRGGDLVLRFYASDTIKVIGPVGPAPASYNVNLTDPSAVGAPRPSLSATTQAYFHDQILVPGLTASPDGPLSTHSVLEVVGHPAVEFVQRGPHFTTSEMGLALNNHQELDVISTDLTRAQLVQAATAAVSG